MERRGAESKRRRKRRNTIHEAEGEARIQIVRPESKLYRLGRR